MNFLKYMHFKIVKGKLIHHDINYQLSFYKLFQIEIFNNR